MKLTLLALFLLSMSGAANEKQPATSPDAATVRTETVPARLEDQSFVDQAIQSCLTEIAASELVAIKSTNARIKAYAQQMIGDHARLNRAVRAAAKASGITPRARQPEASVIDKLEGLHGADFDQAYAEAALKGHEETVALFERQAGNDQDKKLQALAQKSLPPLRHHLEMARALASQN
ncbi:DUF4142 domain-containing protein [Chitinimonas naiadis]